MKIRTEIDPSIETSEIVIRAPYITEELLQIQKALLDANNTPKQMVFYKETKEYYFPLDRVLFFSTNERQMDAHTADEVFQVKYKLYELENELPLNFLRVSKSTILNVDKIFSVTKNITSVSTVEFANSHKEVYVSRHYFNTLQNRLESRRLYHEKKEL
jgi:DNA-binding LytR/AlgR family response regulator